MTSPTWVPSTLVLPPGFDAPEGSEEAKTSLAAMIEKETHLRGMMSLVAGAAPIESSLRWRRPLPWVDVLFVEDCVAPTSVPQAHMRVVRMESWLRAATLLCCDSPVWKSRIASHIKSAALSELSGELLEWMSAQGVKVGSFIASVSSVISFHNILSVENNLEAVKYIDGLLSLIRAADANSAKTAYLLRVQVLGALERLLVGDYHSNPFDVEYSDQQYYAAYELGVATAIVLTTHGSNACCMPVLEQFYIDSRATSSKG